MLARTRVDVDALNTRARTAAVADGHITGPAVTAGDGKEWQAGDLLRTRRNNRSLPLGDSHVRNGDRFRVLGPGPDSTAGEQGLIVEDLAGRGRTVLPADYLAEYCEYGWASTIDAAQGSTAVVGILLVRLQRQRQQQPVQLAQLDAEISQVRNRLEVHDREWNARRATQAPTPRRTAAVPDALGTLTPPSRPTTPPTSRTTTRPSTRPSTRPAGWPTGWPTRPALDPRTGAPSRSPVAGPYRPGPQAGPGRDSGRSR